jgi:hypothetical protein
VPRRRIRPTASIANPTHAAPGTRTQRSRAAASKMTKTSAQNRASAGAVVGNSLDLPDGDLATRPLASLEWLLKHRGLINAKRVARALGLENVERVYSLPLTQVALSDRTTRFCPVEVHRLAVTRVKPANGAMVPRPAEPPTDVDADTPATPPAPPPHPL